LPLRLHGHSPRIHIALIPPLPITVQGPAVTKVPVHPPSCHPPGCHPPSCHPPSCHRPSCHPPDCHPPDCHPPTAATRQPLPPARLPRPRICRAWSCLRLAFPEHRAQAPERARSAAGTQARERGAREVPRGLRRASRAAAVRASAQVKVGMGAAGRSGLLRSAAFSPRCRSGALPRIRHQPLAAGAERCRAQVAALCFAITVKRSHPAGDGAGGGRGRGAVGEWAVRWRRCVNLCVNRA